jgi:glutathione S-transferase
MKYYDSIGPNPRVVRMVMAEKGITPETVKIDLMGGENRQSAYVSKVPTGSTPCVELDSGMVLSEITAIAEYLEELHPNPPLIGTTPEERAETRMWVRRIDHGIMEPMANGFRASEGRQLFESRMKLVGPEGAKDLKDIARHKLMWLDGLMQGRTWICGDRYTLADILLLAFVEFGASVGQPLPEEATWLHDWAKRAAARPSSAA